MKVILESKDVSKSFGAVTAAENISVRFEKDTVVGLIGTNGAGKTTFINMITGYLKPTSGTIHFLDRDITPLLPREITRLGICRSFQTPQLYDTLSVEENLMIGLGIARRNMKRPIFSRGPKTIPGHKGTAREAAQAMMGRFALTEYGNKPAKALPGGVRKLLDIAMAMIVKPLILLLDEPTSGVSAEEKFGIMDMVMDAVRAEGVTVIFVEHDMDIVARYSGRALAFYDGRIIADAKPEEVLADEEVLKLVIGGKKKPHRAKGSSDHA